MPIKEIGIGATEDQKAPNIIAKTEKTKANVVKLKYHNKNDNGPNKIVAKKIIKTINAKDAII